MVTQNELKAFYETDLKPKLLFFEEQRLLLTSKRKVLWIIYGILVIFAILAVIMVFNLEAGYLQTIYRKFVGEDRYFYYVDDKDVRVFVVFVLIIYMITFYMAVAYSYTKMKSTYRNRFKTTVVGSLVTFIDKNLNYTPKDNSTAKELLFKQEFHNSDLFSRRKEVYRWSGEDYVGGILGGTSLKFSEIHAETQYTRKKYSHSVSYPDIFKGLFFVFNVNWNFEGVTTIIVPNDSWDYFLKKYLSLVKKESKFKVYSDNPTIAKYIFSTPFMDRLLALHNKLKVPIELSFVNSKLYMAISIEENLFEPPISSTVLDFQLIQTIFEYMNLGKEIVEELIVLMKQPNQMDLK
ncbi:DUF3137 domain-containing protein [Candidatus Parabeggiatoa sp. HSG14]|uniref:DUF3137 domain-containing protein n=1 Tax=Candidatus Parabeggiatoa sp. HSG14 TaxID=3055593 RepID=UPI0025A73D71|nr:DUF3137 domain-containing protein [Thiotrichales bacterium HSG14]